MPLDQTTYIETTPDVFSLDGLLVWLETQPGETEWSYYDTRDCLLYRYFRTRGVPTKSCGGKWQRDPEGNKHTLPRALADVAVQGGRTYASALDCARKIKAIL